MFSWRLVFVFGHVDVAEDLEGSADGGAVEGGGDDVLPGRTRQTVAPALHGCTLEVKKGELVAIVGAVGSGKSRHVKTAYVG